MGDPLGILVDRRDSTKAAPATGDDPLGILVDRREQKKNGFSPGGASDSSEEESPFLLPGMTRRGKQRLLEQQQQQQKQQEQKQQELPPEQQTNRLPPMPLDKFVAAQDEDTKRAILSPVYPWEHDMNVTQPTLEAKPEIPANKNLLPEIPVLGINSYKSAADFISRDIQLQVGGLALQQPEEKFSLANGQPPDKYSLAQLNTSMKVSATTDEVLNDPAAMKNYYQKRQKDIDDQIAVLQDQADHITTQYNLPSYVMTTATGDIPSASNPQYQELQKQINTLKQQRTDLGMAIGNAATVTVAKKHLASGQPVDLVALGKDYASIMDPQYADDEKAMEGFDKAMKQTDQPPTAVAAPQTENDQYLSIGEPKLGTQGAGYQPEVVQAAKSDIAKSYQILEHKFYKDGADLMRNYYSVVSTQKFDKALPIIQQVNELIQARDEEVAKYPDYPINTVAQAYQRRINQLMQDDNVKAYMQATGSAVDYADKSQSSEDLYPQVKRQSQRQILNDAWYASKELEDKIYSAIGIAPGNVGRWIFGSMASNEKDIKMLSEATGIDEETVRSIANEKVSGLFGVSPGGVRTSGALQGLAKGADEAMAESVKGARRFFNTANADMQNRILTDKENAYQLEASKNRVYDQMGNLNLNPQSIFNEMGRGVGQSTVLAAPALVTGGLAGEGTLLAKMLEGSATVASGFAMSYDDSYKEAAMLTSDERLRRKYANVVAMENALPELLLSPAEVVKKFSGGASKAALFKEFVEGAAKDGLEETAKKRIIKSLGQFGEVLLAENIEEQATLLTSEATKNSMLGPQYDLYYKTHGIKPPGLMEQAIQTAISTTISTLPLAVGAGISSYKDASGIRKEALFEAGNEADLYRQRTKDLLDKGLIDQATHDKHQQTISTMAGLVTEVNKLRQPNGKPFSYDEKVQIAAQQYRIELDKKLKPNAGTASIAGSQQQVEDDTQVATAMQHEVMGNPVNLDKVPPAFLDEAKDYHTKNQSNLENEIKGLEFMRDQLQKNPDDHAAEIEMVQTEIGEKQAQLDHTNGRIEAINTKLGIKAEPVTTITPQDIHTAAAASNINADTDEFRDLSQKLTGEGHLDNMNPAQLQIMMDYVKKPPPDHGVPAPSAKTAAPVHPGVANEIEYLEAVIQEEEDYKANQKPKGLLRRVSDRIGDKIFGKHDESAYLQEKKAQLALIKKDPLAYFEQQLQGELDWKAQYPDDANENLIKYYTDAVAALKEEAPAAPAPVAEPAPAATASSTVNTATSTAAPIFAAPVEAPTVKDFPNSTNVEMAADAVTVTYAKEADVPDEHKGRMRVLEEDGKKVVKVSIPTTVTPEATAAAPAVTTASSAVPTATTEDLMGLLGTPEQQEKDRKLLEEAQRLLQQQPEAETPAMPVQHGPVAGRQLAPGQPVTTLPDSKEVGTNIITRFKNAPKWISNRLINRTDPSSGVVVKGRWALVPVESITPSHNPNDFADSEGYPVDKDGNNVNSTDYSKPDTQVSVHAIGGNYNQSALDNAPVVTHDGVVVSGNNRVMSGQLAAQNGTRQLYDEELKNRLGDANTPSALHGATIDDYNHVATGGTVQLVFLAEGKPEYTPEYYLSFNKTSIKLPSAVALAIQLGRTVSERVMQTVTDLISGPDNAPHESMSDFYENHNATRDTFKALTSGPTPVIPPTNLPAYINMRTGVVSATGKEFLESLLVGNLLAPENVAILDEEGMKAYRGKIVQNIQALSELQKNPDYALGAILDHAVSLLNEFRQSKAKSLADFLDEQTMIHMPNRSAESMIMAHMLMEKPNSFKKIINDYKTKADNASSTGGMFGEVESIPQKEILAIALNINNEQLKRIEAIAAANQQLAEGAGETTGKQPSNISKPAKEETKTTPASSETAATVEKPAEEKPAAKTAPQKKGADFGNIADLVNAIMELEPDLEKRTAILGSLASKRNLGRTARGKLNNLYDTIVSKTTTVAKPAAPAAKPAVVTTTTVAAPAAAAPVVAATTASSTVTTASSNAAVPNWQKVAERPDVTMAREEADLKAQQQQEIDQAKADVVKIQEGDKATIDKYAGKATGNRDVAALGNANKKANSKPEGMTAGRENKIVQAYADHIIDVKLAMKNNEYQKAIKAGTMTAAEAKAIIESVNEQVPADIEEQAAAQPEAATAAAPAAEAPAAEPSTKDKLHAGIDTAMDKLFNALSAKLPPGTQKQGFGDLRTILDNAAKILHAAVDASANIAEKIQEAVDYVRGKWDEAWGDFPEDTVREHFTNIVGTPPAEPAAEEPKATPPPKTKQPPKPKAQPQQQQEEPPPPPGKGEIDGVDNFQMKADGEMTQFMSNKTWWNIFREKAAGDAKYRAQTLQTMLSDGLTMLANAREHFGSTDILSYGPKLYDHIRNMGEGHLNNKAVLMATFLAEIKKNVNDAETSKDPRAPQMKQLEDRMFRYYKKYMNEKGKQIVAGRLLRMFRNQFMAEAYHDQILEDAQIKAKQEIQDAIDQKQIDDQTAATASIGSSADTETGITEEQKAAADQELQDLHDEDVKGPTPKKPSWWRRSKRKQQQQQQNKKSKGAMSKTEAAQKAQQKAEELRKKMSLGSADEIAKKLKDESDNLNCI